MCRSVRHHQDYTEFRVLFINDFVRLRYDFDPISATVLVNEKKTPFYNPFGWKYLRKQCCLSGRMTLPVNTPEVLRKRLRLIGKN